MIKRLVLAIVLLFTLPTLVGCPEPDRDCMEHSQKITNDGDIFLCKNGKWIRTDNPNRPPTKA
jgi:hypothetical protein